MRGFFGIASLLIVLAIVAHLATRQMKAVEAVSAHEGAAPVNRPAQTADKVRDDVGRALEQGASQREEVDK